MKSSSSDINRKHVIDINWADSWQVYQRLQELYIPSISKAHLHPEMVLPKILVRQIG